MKVQHNVPLTSFGRKDIYPSPRDRYNKYKDFPIEKLTNVGYSFIADEEYSYGKTISIKNACRTKAKKLKLLYKFAVREWRGKTRVWRTE